jgi:hypothetical protein
MLMGVHYPNEIAVKVGQYARDPSRDMDPHRTRMTLAQASYLMTLCEETDEILDDSLTQAEAAELIEQLEDVTGRGRRHRPPTA